MTTQLTYEELDQRIIYLEKKLSSQSNLRYLEDIFNYSNLPIFIKDCNFKYILMNHKLQQLGNMVGKQIIGQDDFAIFSKPVAELFRSQDKKIIKTKATIEFEETIVLEDGNEYSFMTSKFPLFDDDGHLYAIGGLCTDITVRQKIESDLKEARESLCKSHEELEKRVADRTKDLNQLTEELLETNAALKVLLKKRDEDRQELGEAMALNIEKIILPYLGKLKITTSSKKQSSIIQMIDSNLSQISSSLGRKQTAYLAKLTPTQIHVANLIKQGMTSKEIATLLNLSPSTIACHRQEIRKRLSLNNKKSNLRTILLSLS